jgi:CRP-like cAMP-binding protein
MLEQHSVGPPPQSGFALRDVKHAECVRHTPRQNRLLAALPAADYGRLLPYLELIPWPLGWTVYEAGTRMKYVYLPTSGVVSRICVTGNGESTEIAVTGNEGLVGIALIMGGETSPRRVTVHSAGYAYRLKADVLQEEFDRGGPLQRLLLRYVQALITQMAQSAVCNRHHTLEQQLCRWLLSNLDRLPSNELTVTQELIANLLGVRREGVTLTAGHLQQSGLIRYSRGHISVLDRAKLEALTCECYAVVKEAFERLLPDTNAVDVPAKGRIASSCAKPAEQIAA